MRYKLYSHNIRWKGRRGVWRAECGPLSLEVRSKKVPGRKAKVYVWVVRKGTKALKKGKVDHRTFVDGQPRLKWAKMAAREVCDAYESLMQIRHRDTDYPDDMHHDQDWQLSEHAEIWGHRDYPLDGSLKPYDYDLMNE